MLIIKNALLFIVSSICIAITAYLRIKYGAAPWYLVFPAMIALVTALLAVSNLIDYKKLLTK